LPQDAHAIVERPVRIGNEVVAMVRMVTLKPVPSEVEVRFLNTQYQSIVVMACVLLLIALVGAFWISGHWVRPLIAVQAATEKIAQGEFDTRLNTTRSDEIGDAMRNINQMAAGLKKLEGARRQWIADMSHELRTPLTVLRGEIDALIDGVIALTPKAMLSLREEVLQLNALVDDLHLLAMSDLKALPCYFEDVDAARLVEGIVQKFALRAAQLGLALTLVTQLEAPVMVRWDAKRIEQLLGNLLDNSLAYTDAPGQLVVRLCSGEDNKLAIEVEDTAPGVSGSDLLRIFEPLYRGDASRGRSTGGSGLGLAICEQIVKAHHGAIRAEPSPLGGVLFHLELPRIGDEAV
jgi:two-component system sensor histidine kinase BaeS